jgi:hypothetical protein
LEQVDKFLIYFKSLVVHKRFIIFLIIAALLVVSGAAVIYYRQGKLTSPSRNFIDMVKTQPSPTGLIKTPSSAEISPTSSPPWEIPEPTLLPEKNIVTYKKGYMTYSVFEDFWIADLEGYHKVRLSKSKPFSVAISDDHKRILWLEYDEHQVVVIHELDLDTGQITLPFNHKLDIYGNSKIYENAKGIEHLDYLGNSHDLVFEGYLEEHPNSLLLHLSRKDGKLLGLPSDPAIQNQPIRGIHAFPHQNRILIDKFRTEGLVTGIIDLETGKTEAIESLFTKSSYWQAEPKYREYIHAQLSPDGRYVYKAGQVSGKIYFLIYDTMTKKTTDLSGLAKNSDYTHALVSPKNTVAFATQEGERASGKTVTGVISTAQPDGSNLQQIYKENDREILLMGWSEDGGDLYFAEFSFRSGLQVKSINIISKEVQTHLTDLNGGDRSRWDINPKNFNIFSPPLPPLNSPTSAPAQGNETDNWLIYNDPDLGFRLKYPESTFFGNYDWIQEIGGLVLGIRVRKIDVFRGGPGSYGISPEETYSDMMALREPAKDSFCQGRNPACIINLGDGVYGRQSMTLGNRIDCSVFLNRSLTFYRQDSVITISLDGVISETVSASPDYFNDEFGMTCWDFENDGQKKFIEDLSRNNISEPIRNWYDTFDKIVKTIEIY